MRLKAMVTFIHQWRASNTGELRYQKDLKNVTMAVLKSYALSSFMAVKDMLYPQ